MGEYLKPWKRKIGVVTLAMALVLIGGWLIGLSDGTDIVDWRSRLTAHGLTAICWASPRWASPLHVIIPLILISIWLFSSKQQSQGRNVSDNSTKARH